ncbi:alpha/beta hydrolase fold [Candidatus Vecturithrix granuli]|uniref:Alpha/beta hydrolase fold n=1 Tax=Vecturithrix granuli TaxID=1499967 RepID=A0A081C857_VECG1|nr:alpha/beta hydrolase fold [Candidatus Vecturithrix granuli]
MPLIDSLSYTPPLIFRNHHLHTIYPSLFRRVNGVRFKRERIDTPDGDFIDLDWSRIGSEKLLLAIHGLEGSSRSRYIPGIIRAFQRRGWDGVAYNLRGCSGELNRTLRFYHSGDTADLDVVVRYILRHHHYTQLAIVGFSLGGNITLKYVGECGTSVPKELTHAAAVSAPCDLQSSSWKLAESSNILYMKNFLCHFHRKIRMKMRQFPGQISDERFHQIKNFKDYDDRYTAPLHGFASAEDYWAKCSAKPYLPGIRIPTLLINALDDPFLPEACYPVAEAKQNPHFFLEMPSLGGHVGFVTQNSRQEYWHESQITAFMAGCR